MAIALRQHRARPSTPIWCSSVLATSRRRHFQASPRSITNVWAPGALDPIGKDDRVLVIGTGATAVDMVIDLVHRGMRAPITMVSRRGLLPLIDVPAQTDP